MSSDSDESASDATVVKFERKTDSRRLVQDQELTNCEPEAELIASAVVANFAAAEHLDPKHFHFQSNGKVNRSVRGHLLRSMSRALVEFLWLEDENLDVVPAMLKAARVWDLKDATHIARRIQAFIGTYLDENRSRDDVVPRTRTESLLELYQCIDAVKDIMKIANEDHTLGSKPSLMGYAVPPDPLVDEGILKFFRVMDISLSVADAIACRASTSTDRMHPVGRVPIVVYDFGSFLTYHRAVGWLKSPTYVILFGSGDYASEIFDHHDLKQCYGDERRVLVSCKGVDTAAALITKIASSIHPRDPIDELDKLHPPLEDIMALLSHLQTLQGALLFLDGLNITQRDEKRGLEAFLSRLSGCHGLALVVTVGASLHPLRQGRVRLSSHIISADEAGFRISVSNTHSRRNHTINLRIINQVEEILVNALYGDHASDSRFVEERTVQLLRRLQNRRAKLHEEHTVQLQPTASGLRRRRRMKGYLTDDGSFEASTEEQTGNEMEGVKKDECDGATTDTELVIRFKGVLIATIRRLSANLLPTTHLSAGFTASITIASSFCDSSTCYRALREAQTDDDFDVIKTSLVEEWKFIATILSAIGGVATTVFVSSPGTIFEPDKVALRCLGLSATTSAIGLLMCFILLYRCLRIDAQTFRKLALGLREDYIYFALTSRLPFVSSLLASVSMSLFLLAVAYRAWPSIVVTVTVVFAVLICLQYIVKGGEILWDLACKGAAIVRDRIVSVAESSRDRLTTLFTRTVPPQAVAAPSAQAPAST
ncbi:hypothetical protein PENSPDRAFT_750051 [Peniophora sp. CONT]|nr:hypothetical protein PENSPDRAFT_750051 [Peniophora sp. CONT]